MPCFRGESNKHFLRRLMQVSAGILPASSSKIGSSKIRSFSLSALVSLCSTPTSFSPSLSLPSLSLPRFAQAPPHPWATEMARSPSSLGYDHFCADFVKFQPQFSFVEKHLDPFHALRRGEKSHTDRLQERWAFLSPRLHTHTDFFRLQSLGPLRLRTAPSQLWGTSRPARESQCKHPPAVRCPAVS